MYVDDYPVGEVMIRTELNEFWKYNSGNIGYKIRPSERNKGYGYIILKLALEKCCELNMHNVYLQCLKNNIYSSRVISRNNGKLINEDKDTLYYEIKL
jgi:predicted acetyltransferase